MRYRPLQTGDILRDVAPDMLHQVVSCCATQQSLKMTYSVPVLRHFSTRLGLEYSSAETVSNFCNQLTV